MTASVKENPHKSDSLEQPKIYLPGLNGLRALAALTVLISHIFQDTFGNWNLKYLRLPFFTDGVTLFFVISGFLITYLLLREIKEAETINIAKFYFRRILRIWPIYYLQIILITGVLFLFNKESEILNDSLPYYLFFTANIAFVLSKGIPLLVHYWSIGVEEQFYLFWPWLLRVCKNRIITVTMFVLCLWMGLKIGSFLFFTNKSLIYIFFSVTRFHCMMIGAIGAIGYFNKSDYFLSIFTNKWSQTGSWFVFLFSGFIFPFIPAVVTAEVIALLSLFLIMSQIEGKPKFINLENRYFDFIGKISYGIYVIHPLVIFLLSTLWRQFDVVLNEVLQYLIIYFTVPCVTIFTAWALYELYEKPFLNLKNKWAIVKSSNTMNLN